jgi:sulfide:quinone oxidoreductase
MSARAADPERPVRVVVAGGGIAGLELLVGLRALAGDRVAPILIAPHEAFGLRALATLEPFHGVAPRRYPLAGLTEDLRVQWRRDHLAHVDLDRRVAAVRSGAEVAFDMLVIAIGAVPYPTFDHGVVFGSGAGTAPLAAMLGDVRSGRARSVAIVAPQRSTWTLPAYELAFQLAAVDPPAGPRVVVVTAEPEPLAAFGPAAGAMIRSELEAAGVELVTGAAPAVASDRLVELPPGRTLHADRIVHLALPAGPRPAGVLYDADGFVPVDADLQVGDDPDVFAAGDAVAGTVKSGGLAAQQADAVAERIAWRTGAVGRPAPYAPVLRGVVWTARGPRYLRAEPGGDCEVSDRCLWWPPSKVATRWLAPWLASRDLRGPFAVAGS